MPKVTTSPREKAAATAGVTASLTNMPLGAMIDKLYDLREKKRELEAQIKVIDGEFDGIEEQVMSKLAAEQVDASRGSKASCSISKTVVANIVDFDALAKYVKKTGYVHLFQRRISDPAFRELLDQGKKVPGLEPFTKSRLNLKSLT